MRLPAHPGRRGVVRLTLMTDCQLTQAIVGYCACQAYCPAYDRCLAVKTCANALKGLSTAAELALVSE